MPLTHDISVTHSNNNSNNSLVIGETKNCYGEYGMVRLTAKEYEQLIEAAVSEEAVKDKIDYLDYQLVQKSKRYTSLSNHYVALKRWLSDDRKKAREEESTRQIERHKEERRYKEW